MNITRECKGDKTFSMYFLKTVWWQIKLERDRVSICTHGSTIKFIIQLSSKFWWVQSFNLKFGSFELIFIVHFNYFVLLNNLTWVGLQEKGPRILNQMLLPKDQRVSIWSLCPNYQDQQNFFRIYNRCSIKCGLLAAF